MTQSIDLIELFRAELELCKLHSGESLAVLTQDNESEAYASAVLAASRALGADAFQVNVARPPPDDGPASRSALAGNQPAIEALKSVDMVVDLLGLLWSPEQTEITDAGPRMLLVKEPPDILARMLPTPDLRRRVEAARARLAEAREMRITSAAGTDVTYSFGGYRSVDQYGYTDTPGRWDHFPSAFVFTGAREEGVEGRVVLDRGDIILSSVAGRTPPLRRYVDAPVSLTVSKGMVVGIDGGEDAAILKKYIDQFDDPRAYSVSHIGWGMHDAALWDYLASGENRERTGGMDGRSYYGNVLFSTGPDSEFGGGNTTACHLDIPLRNCDLFLDGEQILSAGEVLPEAMRA